MMKTSIPSGSVTLCLPQQVVELEMDMEVKSEPDSEDDMMDCSISVTSSVEVCRPEYAQSDEEELEEEPLIEIESVMVSQQLVKDELEPNLLLFVKKDPVESDQVINTICSSGYLEKSLFSTDDKFTQTDTADKVSITKVLRSVKKKLNNSFKNAEQNDKSSKNITKFQRMKTFQNTSAKGNAVASSLPSGLSSHAELRSLEKLPKKNNFSTEHGGKEIEGGNKLKLQIFSQETKQTSGAPEEILSQSLSNEQNLSNKAYVRDDTEKEACLFIKSTGKENAQRNNENENTSDSVLSSDQSESNVREENKTNKKRKVTPKPSFYDCTVCGKQFREKSHLATHARAHNDVRNFRCNKCGVLFKTKTNLFFHMKTHEAPFTCTKCNKTFRLKKMFTRHLRVVHSGEGLYNCDICGRPFKSAQNLELHYTLHTGNKPFSCERCCKTFVYKSTYRAHLKAHDADEQFDCSLCLAAGALSQDKSELRRRCSHYSQVRPWLCTVCGKAYPLKSTLRNHMKSHEAEKPFKCEECGKHFMKRQTYECHLKTHSGEKPQYMCDQCSQSYYSYVSLKRHYLKHTSERQFVCDLCSKAFWTKDALKVHRRSHENTKTFQCTQCTKAFAHKHSLVAHLRSHTGETSHACEICCKTFLHKYHLTRHLRQHSPPPPLLPPPHSLPLAPSLYMLPPHNHMDLPTLQIL